MLPSARKNADNKWLNWIAIAVLVSSAVSGTPQQAAASSLRKYKPPSRGDTQRTEGSGSRGCDKNPVFLNLLIPSDHVALTVSSHPSFFWYVSDVTSPLRFTVVEQGVAHTLIDKRFTAEKPGIVLMQLPTNVPGLDVGKEYRWTVSIVCNPLRPSENLYAIGRISRVPVNPELDRELALTNSNDEKATVYAESGIWYDALNASYKNASTTYFISLLEQVGITKVTQQIRHLTQK